MPGPKRVPNERLSRCAPEEANSEVIGVSQWRDNGNAYNNRYHYLGEIRNGRVVAVREYLDSAHVAGASAE